MRKALAILFPAFIAANARAQSRPSDVDSDLAARLASCQSENVRLQSENLTLSARLHDQTKGSPELKDAFAAIRAVWIVLRDRDEKTFRRYYLAARVKLEALPESEGKVSLQSVMDVYSDIAMIWTHMIEHARPPYRPHAFPQSVIDNLKARYPGLEDSARISVNRHTEKGFMEEGAAMTFLTDFADKAIKNIQ